MKQFFVIHFVLFVPFCGSTSSAAEPTYWQDVRPVLRKHCTICHNPARLAEPEVSGGLVLDTYDSVVKNAKKPLVHAGKGKDSPLVQIVVTKDEEKRMPLGSKPLAPEAVELLTRWIDAGAKEGTKPAETAAAVEAPRPGARKKLDVTLTTTTTPPADLLAKGPGKPLALDLKVGPLPPVTAVAFRPDGRELAVGGYGRVVVWDLAAGKPVKVLTNVLAAVNDVKYSPDGALLAVAGGQPSAKGDLRLYQTADWKLLAVLGGHEDVVASVAFRHDGKQLASAGFDRTVRVWDVATGKAERALTGHSDFVHAVAYSPDGAWLASASKDRSVKLVEAATGKSRFTFGGANDDVLAVAVHPDGKQVVSAGLEPALVWWNAETGARGQAQGSHRGAVHEVCFSRDGKLAASAGGDAAVVVWNGADGKPLRVIPTGSVAYAVALAPDNKYVVSGHFDGTVRFHEPATGQPLLTLLAVPGPDGAPDWLAQTPRGHTAGSDALVSLGRWRMGAEAVDAAAVWKELTKPDVVPHALKGETAAAPFGK